MALLTVILLGALGVTLAIPGPTPVVKMVVVLPLRGEFPWSIPATLPAIEYAVESIEKHDAILCGYKIQVTAKDSRCSETYGPLAAIDAVMNTGPHVFLGPACDYALAPVARFSPFWGIPVLTAGGKAPAFGDKAQYRLLTRTQASYEEAGEFFANIFMKFNWTKVGLFYDRSKTSAQEGWSDCHFAMESIFIAAKKYLGVRLPQWPFSEQDPSLDKAQILKDVSKEVRSKIFRIKHLYLIPYTDSLNRR